MPGDRANTFVLDWDTEQVSEWLNEKGHSSYTIEQFCFRHNIDGRVLLSINEHDMAAIREISIGNRKRLYLDIRQLKDDSYKELISHGYDPRTLMLSRESSRLQDSTISQEACQMFQASQSKISSNVRRATELHPEYLKTVIALGYLFVVTWITAFVMVIVHDRVPDMKKYPPLPDIFLDNVPYIPWAFQMCEWTGTFLFVIWLGVLVLHKHRFILLRRFFGLSGTVFLLRCITMLITSLSVPGSHLDCNPRISPHSSDGSFLDLMYKMKQAYMIWKGAGMSIQGVRTCGDYMFSGHTVALTMLNFFITEYTPRDLCHGLHIFTWLLNMFGIFFILCGHEHYSIDVFIAFYITSRLFLYYHCLANNQALMQKDSTRVRAWFPLFSFFESSIDGIVPNEFEPPTVIAQKLLECVINPFMNITGVSSNYFTGRSSNYFTDILPNDTNYHTLESESCSSQTSASSQAEVLNQAEESISSPESRNCHKRSRTKRAENFGLNLST